MQLTLHTIVSRWGAMVQIAFSWDIMFLYVRRIRWLNIEAWLMLTRTTYSNVSIRTHRTIIPLCIRMPTDMVLSLMGGDCGLMSFATFYTYIFHDADSFLFFYIIRFLMREALFSKTKKGITRKIICFKLWKNHRMRYSNSGGNYNMPKY